MGATKSVTKWLGGAAVVAAMFFGFSHKAEAQYASFGVHDRGPVVIERPEYGYSPYAYRSYGHVDAWRHHEVVEHERFDRDRRFARDDHHFDRDHDRGFRR